MRAPTIGSLFAGIGGLELGFELAGWDCRWQVELDPFARSVLKRHWPGVRRHDDIRTWPTADTEPVDCIVGGFPCQDLSAANVKGRKGLAGARSGLALEFVRVVGALEPRIAVVENSGQSWRSWVPVVRRELHTRGYASVPIRVCASDAGAPHKRDRVFLVADSHGDGQRLREVHAQVASLCAHARRLRGEWRAAVLERVGDDDGLSMRMVTALGNAVVPQVACIIARAIRTAWRQ